MILPSKHLEIDDSLLGIGARIIDLLPRPSTVTSLWERIRGEPAARNFDRFSLALDLLYAMGAVDIQNGMLRRASQ